MKVLVFVIAMTLFTVADVAWFFGHKDLTISLQLDAVFAVLLYLAFGRQS